MKVEVKLKKGRLPLEIKRLFFALYMEGLGIATADGVRNAVAAGLDATGAPLPVYRSGPASRRGKTVTLRETGRTLDDLRPREVSAKHVLVFSTDYAGHVHRYSDAIGITDEVLDQARAMVEDALTEAVQKAGRLAARGRGGRRRKASKRTRRSR